MIVSFQKDKEMLLVLHLPGDHGIVFRFLCPIFAGRGVQGGHRSSGIGGASLDCIKIRGKTEPKTEKASALSVCYDPTLSGETRAVKFLAERQETLAFVQKQSL